MTQPSPARRSPDLETRELPLAQAFGRLGRARPAAWLREQVLVGARPAGVALELPHGGLRLGRLAAAAALLAALSGGLLAGSHGPRSPSAGARTAGRAVAWARTTPAIVVDDPSVSLFHGLETFDRLAFEGLGGPPR